MRDIGQLRQPLFHLRTGQSRPLHLHTFSRHDRRRVVAGVAQKMALGETLMSEI